MKYNVIFSGFDTMQQAEEFAAWYAGSGEQDTAWLEEYTELSGAFVSDITTHNGNVLVNLDIAYKADE